MQGVVFCMARPGPPSHPSLGSRKTLTLLGLPLYPGLPEWPLPCISELGIVHFYLGQPSQVPSVRSAFERLGELFHCDWCLETVNDQNCLWHCRRPNQPCSPRSRNGGCLGLSLSSAMARRLLSLRFLCGFRFFIPRFLRDRSAIITPSNWCPRRSRSITSRNGNSRGQ